MEILNLTSNEITGIQERSGLRNPKPEDRDMIRNIIATKEKVPAITYQDEKFQTTLFKILADRLAAIAKKYDMPTMIGQNPHNRDEFQKILENVLKEQEIKPVYCLISTKEKPIRTIRGVKERDRAFKDYSDTSITDTWELQVGKDKKEFRRFHEVRIEETGAETTIKWYIIE